MAVFLILLFAGIVFVLAGIVGMWVWEKTENELLVFLVMIAVIIGLGYLLIRAGFPWQDLYQ